jgi:hypothetical protein
VTIKEFDNTGFFRGIRALIDGKWRRVTAAVGSHRRTF